MTINDYLQQKKISKYRLSKMSGVPYATVSDICNGKAELPKCSVETVYRIATALDISLNELLDPYFAPRPDFALFKSNVCHHLKEVGDKAFIIETLENGEIFTFYKRSWYPECFYLLAMLDYISAKNGIPLCRDYDALRNCKLDTPIYPAGIEARCIIEGNEQAKEEALRNAIPAFLKYNIIECDVRNVV